MPAPTIESHNQRISSGGTTTFVNVTAAGAGRVIVVCTTIGLQNTSAFPSLSISGGGANVGAWTSIGMMPAPTVVVGIGVQAWYTVTTGAVSAQPVTITSAGTIDDAATAYLAIAGANTAAPLDTNTVLARGGGNNGTGAKGQTSPSLAAGTASVAVSTTTANVLAVVLMGNNAQITFTPLQSGTTLTENVVNGGGTFYAYLGVMTAPFTTAQTGTQVGSTSTQASAGFAFGITADGGAGVAARQYAISVVT